MDDRASQQNAGPTRDGLEDLAHRAVEPLGLEMVHLEYRKEGRRWVVRLYIDRDGGITLDDCARASEQFGALLEAANLIPHRYNLEVSSPGLDRPLFTEGDYRRFASRRARLTTHRPVGGRRHHQGVLLGCTEGTVTIRLDDGHEQSIPLELIASGRLKVELGHEVTS